MNNNPRLLRIVMILLLVSAVVIAVFLTKMPLAFRVAAAALDLFAAVGIWTLLRQRRR